MQFSNSPGVLMLATGSILWLPMEKTGTTNAGRLAYQEKDRIKKNATDRAKETRSHDLPDLDLNKICNS